MLICFNIDVVQIYPSAAPKQVIVQAMGDEASPPSLKFGQYREDEIAPILVHPYGKVSLYEWRIQVVPDLVWTYVISLTSCPMMKAEELGDLVTNQFTMTLGKSGECTIVLNDMLFILDDYDPTCTDPTPLEQKIANAIAPPLSVFDCILDGVI